MHVRTGPVAGVDDCVMWRIGFTGELSYELHVPAGYGLHVWEALIEQGADLGVAPFGVEAQRILRLEKGHLDRRAGHRRPHPVLTPPGSTGRSSSTRRTSSASPSSSGRQNAATGPSSSGCRPKDGTVVPPGGQPDRPATAVIVGRITSSRMSPTLGRSICLGQLAHHLAEPGTELTVVLPTGGRTRAVVNPQLAHFDPEGKRLRG